MVAALAALGFSAVGCGQAALSGGQGGGDEGAVREAKQAVVSAQVCLDGVTRIYRQGAAGTVWDVQIASGTQAKNYGASTTFNAGVLSGVERRTLLQFDLSAIPSGDDTNITGANLVLMEGNVLPTAQRALEIHRITAPPWTLAPYGETVITWQSFAADGAFDPTPAAFLNNSTNPASKLLQTSITQLVADWVHGVNPNDGILLMDPGGPNTNFWSSEYTNLWARPYLAVCYTITCHTGWADCNVDGHDGCETFLPTSVAHCGACGDACQVPNAAPACVNGACAIGACDLGFADCNASPADGCETLSTTNQDCGGCGVPCARANGAASCTTGTCTLTGCDPGFFDCDGDPQDGCEPAPCPNGAHCAVGADCQGGVCQSGICALPACNDGIKNGAETAPDCGGGACPPCAAGLACAVAADCQSNGCVSGVCQAASCNDGIKNGAETAVDCGGGVCPGCADGLSCATGADCAGGVCTAGLCQAPACNDGVRNGAETAIDCGGGVCAACVAGKACSVAADCVDQVCTSGVCQIAGCNDAVKNGGETDVDCGGSCTACQNLQACNTDADCDSGDCLDGVCQPTCGHGILDGGGTTTCGVGACQVTVMNCVGGLPQTCVPLLSSPEVCDGIDNDCNGVVDDGCSCVNGHVQSCYSGPGTTLDVGVCHAGTQTCAHGNWGTCAGEVTPGAEVCDGFDNDCDGSVDEALGTTTCGLGECAVTTPNCLNGYPQSCTPRPESPEICDGLDNDCNGAADDLEPIACGVGACQSTAPACVNGADNTCVEGAPSAEICDGIDNDCDGAVDDNNPGGGLFCNTAMHGVCGAGTTTCANGQTVCHQDVQASAETCDGLDNDCDGAVDDNNPGGGVGCAAGQPGICAAGVTVCAGGQLTCSQTLQPTAEVCNGVDDDCDGTVDDGNPGGGLSCDTGLPGLCAAGTTACQVGQVVCVQAVFSSPETCDGFDHDCDGVVNTGCVCQNGQTLACYTGAAGTQGVGVCVAGVQTCVAGDWGPCVGEVTPSAEACDGLDDDCDNAVDEGLPTLSCGLGACARTTPSCVNGQPQVCVPGAPQAELCDGLDNDCDGAPDDGDPGGGQVCNTGLFGVCAAGTTACVAGATQCVQDLSPSPELCDGADNDCDGLVDDNASNALTWYRDADNDSFGDAAVTIQSCQAPAGYVADDTDCNDDDPKAHPGNGTCGGHAATALVCGGDVMSSASYSVVMTLGESPAGATAHSQNYKLHGGLVGATQGP